MNDNKFWLSIWVVVAIMFVTLVGSITYYNHNKNERLLEILDKSQHPVETACGYYMNDTSASTLPPACYLLIKQETK